jgi:hypothetical protein
VKKTPEIQTGAMSHEEQVEILEGIAREGRLPLKSPRLGSCSSLNADEPVAGGFEALDELAPRRR